MCATGIQNAEQTNVTQMIPRALFFLKSIVPFVGEVFTQRRKEEPQSGFQIFFAPLREIISIH